MLSRSSKTKIRFATPLLRYGRGGACLFILVALSVGFKNADGGWIQRDPGVYQIPVEQQTPGGASQSDQSLWILNPTISDEFPCIWDADDHFQMELTGTVEAGQSYSITRCIFGDFKEHEIWIKSATNGVVVSLSVNSDGIGGPYTQASSGANNACIIGPNYDKLGTNMYIPVNGSNGGYAAYTTVTFTATNTLKHKLSRYDVISGITYSGASLPCILGDWFGYDPAWRIGSG